MSASASDEPDSAAAGLSVLNSIEHAEDADCLTLIAGQLGADRASIARLASANRFCRRTVTAASSVWRELCTALWADKVCVAPQAKALLAAGEARQALRFSLEDAKRTELTDEELLTLPWRFRFKAAAGEGWMHADPYWNDQPATRVRFEPSGNMVPTGFEELGHRTLRWQWGRRHAAEDSRTSLSTAQPHRTPRAPPRTLSPTAPPSPTAPCTAAAAMARATARVFSSTWTGTACRRTSSRATRPTGAG